MIAHQNLIDNNIHKLLIGKSSRISAGKISCARPCQGLGCGRSPVKKPARIHTHVQTHVQTHTHTHNAYVCAYNAISIKSSSGATSETL